MSSFNDRIRQMSSIKVKDPENIKLLADMGVSEDMADLGAMAAMNLFKRAICDKDLSAIKEIRTALEGNSDKNSREFMLPAAMIADTFIPVYRDVRDEAHSQYLLYGGRGSTKSSFVSMMIVELLINNPEIHGCICRKVKDTLRDSVYAQVTWAIEVLGLSNSFECRTSPMEIEYLPTGQKLYFRGADKPSKIKSIKPPFGYIGILWFEELDQFSGEEEIRSIEQSVMRGGDRCFVFKTFNPPRSAQSWVNCFARADTQGICRHKSCYLDVPKAWLGKKFIEDAENLKESNPKAYEHEYLGEATGNGGNVFENVELKEISDSEIQAFDRPLFGMDWGWYPDPLRFHGVHFDSASSTLWIFDEISGNKLTNDKICQLLREHGIGESDRITADSGGEGPKTIADFRARGFFMRGAKKGRGSVEYSMKWLSSLKKIIIDPSRCPCAAEEFCCYEFEKNADGTFMSGYPDRNNHSIDAVRYALESVWRKKG